MFLSIVLALFLCCLCLLAGMVIWVRLRYLRSSISYRPSKKNRQGVSSVSAVTGRYISNIPFQNTMSASKIFSTRDSCSPVLGSVMATRQNICLNPSVHHQKITRLENQSLGEIFSCRLYGIYNITANKTCYAAGQQQIIHVIFCHSTE